MLNTVSLIGRLTADPTRRDSSAGQIASFRIAVNRPTKDKTADFFSVTAFGKTAEYVNNYVNKGRLVVVSGRLEVNSYKNKEGVDVQAVQVVANSVNALERGDDAPTQSQEPVKQVYSDIKDPFED